MNKWLILPPVVFFILLAVSMLMSLISKKFALITKNNPEGKTKAYACGENVAENKVQPDYSQFFPFAFFFTIMHVVALIIATVPHNIRSVFGVASLYILAAVSSLFILFRK